MREIYSVANTLLCFCIDIFPYPLSLGIVNEVVETPAVLVPELGEGNTATFVVLTYRIDEVHLL